VAGPRSHTTRIGEPRCEQRAVSARDVPRRPLLLPRREAERALLRLRAKAMKPARTFAMATHDALEERDDIPVQDGPRSEIARLRDEVSILRSRATALGPCDRSLELLERAASLELEVNILEAGGAEPTAPSEGPWPVASADDAARALLARLRSLGARVSVDGGRLIVEGIGKETMTAALQEAVRSLKPRLVAILQDEARLVARSEPVGEPRAQGRDEPPPGEVQNEPGGAAETTHGADAAPRKGTRDVLATPSGGSGSSHGAAAVMGPGAKVQKDADPLEGEQGSLWSSGVLGR
jgi:hypothetical protein